MSSKFIGTRDVPRYIKHLFVIILSATAASLRDIHLKYISTLSHYIMWLIVVFPRGKNTFRLMKLKNQMPYSYVGFFLPFPLFWPNGILCTTVGCEIRLKTMRYKYCNTEF